MKILSGLTLLFIMGAFIACENPSSSFPPFHPPNSGINRISFQQQYIRSSFVGSISLPRLTVISSKNELNNYEALFNFELSQGQLYTPIAFSEAIKDYSEDFFVNNFLVILLYGESSGSNRPQVRGVYDNGDIVINRLKPEVGIPDVAKWSIIIELENRNKLEEFRPVFIEKILPH